MSSRYVKEGSSEVLKWPDGFMPDLRNRPKNVNIGSMVKGRCFVRHL